MTFDSLANAGDYFSPHYLAEVLPKDLRRERLPAWTALEKAGRPSPRTLLRGLRGYYFAARAQLAPSEDSGPYAQLSADPVWRKTLDALHDKVLEGLGFAPQRGIRLVRFGDHDYGIPVLHDDRDVIAIECGWATNFDTAFQADPRDGGPALLPDPIEMDGGRTLRTGSELASFLFAVEDAPRFVLILVGAVVVLADRYAWPEGRYLAVNLDTVLDRKHTDVAGELDTIAALFSGESLHSPAEGESPQLTRLVEASTKHAVGVSTELRTGLQRSVELIANEVLTRIRAAGIEPERIDEPRSLARRLRDESLRYLYRILFLLYAEARPDLGILPSDYPEYAEGYSMARLGDVVTYPLVDDAAGAGFHLYESLNMLFTLVNVGYRPLEMGERESGADEGLRFEALRSDLFTDPPHPLIGRVEHPDWEPGEPDERRFVDTRLRNATLHAVLRLLMLAQGRGKGERGGFISYAQLGINQLGAVYEGLMSYTGFIAAEDLYEVARGGDAKDGSWLVPVSRATYDEKVFVHREDEERGESYRVLHPAGSFVYRLAGRDRESSASYYTPESLTKAVVELAIQQRIAESGGEMTARELLTWRICEPALGSGAFLNEAVNQIAALYLQLRRQELGRTIPPEDHEEELRRVKAYVALHNCYGVDLNPTAVELAEVSIWLNVMHPGLAAPWFGLHLRRGDSLVGASRRYYPSEELTKGAWLSSKDPLPPADLPFRDGPLSDGAVHQFLLPAAGWGTAAGSREARELAPEQTAALMAWRRALRRKPKKGRQVQRLRDLARRTEVLWRLVIRRLEISEREISRKIPVWGADDLTAPERAVDRKKVYHDLHEPGSPYWRLRTLMDAWCALWFWPVAETGLLDGSSPMYDSLWLAAERATSPGQGAGTPAAPFAGQSELDIPLVQASLFDEASVPVSSNTSRSHNRSGGNGRKSKPPTATALTSLDDWLDFAEALLGNHDLPEDSLFAGLTTLDDVSDVEKQLPGMMGMASPLRLPERFPWLPTAVRIAEERGFFHWELDFAHIFAGETGGFDLQLGNPPWVRPRWDEGAVLAEYEPWFKLEDEPPAEEWRERKAKLLESEQIRLDFLGELGRNTSLVAFLSSEATYPLIAGTQPDLYRAFMCRTWANMGRSGVVGLLHEDTHFTGAHEGQLRAAAYRYLRLHGHFQNRRLVFPDIDWNKQFGLHIYGLPQEIDFLHACWLFDPLVLTESLKLTEDGTGRIPGLKYEGTWDLLPHRKRLIRVNEETLANWRRIVGESDTPLDQARLLYPVTSVEETAITVLADWPHRLGALAPSISPGFHESGAKKAGLIRARFAEATDWRDVILRGPQFAIGAPFAKMPPHTRHTDKAIDLVTLAPDAVPTTDYVRACDPEKFVGAQDRWVDHQRLDDLYASPAAVDMAHIELIGSDGTEPNDAAVDAHLRVIASRPYTEFYRAVWREMIPASTERSLFVALLPPGPTHIHAVRTIALAGNRHTALLAGFWAALPLDYAIRIVGRHHVDVGEAKTMPAPQVDHPLASALLLRTLRLNCLTEAYAPLWAELYDPGWRELDAWAADWPGLAPLEAVEPSWTPATPLRTERERRAALVEIDALVSVWLGIDADQLVALYLSRFPQLVDYEAKMYFDADGRKLAENYNQWGHGQTREHWRQLLAYLDDEQPNAPVPDGYTPPFHRADRVAEMRRAHEVFRARLARAGEG